MNNNVSPFDPIGQGIAVGITSGIIIGCYEGLGVLIEMARDYLNEGNYDASTLEREGIRNALVELGFLKRNWWLVGFKRVK